MKSFLLCRKELSQYFKSPIPYILGAIFLFLISLIFFNLLEYFINHIQKLPNHLGGGVNFSESVVMRLYGNINFIFMIITPMISMRLLSEEYKSKTILLLLKSSLSEWEIIIGKYLSALSVLSFIFLLTGIFPLLLFFSGYDDWGIVFSNCLGVFLCFSAYLSLGIFISSLTQNQIVAAVVSVVSVFVFWLLAWLSQSISDYALSKILLNLSVVGHFDNFSQGLISLFDISYYVSFSFFFLFLAKKSIERRRR